MGSDLWLGAITTLAGAALGGGISYLLNRQQIVEARLQRAHTEKREQLLRSFDRRFSAYADFLTQARLYRNAVHDYCLTSDESRPTVSDINALLRQVNSASALVFLVLESQQVYDTCVAILMAMGSMKEAVNNTNQPTSDLQVKFLEPFADLMIRFQNAARAELGVLNANMLWLTGDSIAAATSPESGTKTT